MDKYTKRQLILYDIGNISSDNELLKHYSVFLSVIGDNIEYHSIKNESSYYYTSDKGYIIYVSKYRDRCYSYIIDSIIRKYKEKLESQNILSMDSIERYLYIIVSHLFNRYESGCIYSTKEQDLKLLMSGPIGERIY